MPENKVLKILKTPELRARLAFVLSALATLAFVAFNTYAAIVYDSIWYGSLAVYYTVLVLQKLFVIIAGWRIARRCADDQAAAEQKKLRIYLLSGIFLLILDIALTASIIQMIAEQDPVRTGMIIAIATAAYSFYKIIFASINAVKAYKTRDILLQVIRNITLVAAIVSLLALTSTMMGTFGSLVEYRAFMIAVSAGVGLVIFSFGIFMIVNGALKLRVRERPPQEI